MVGLRWLESDCQIHASPRDKATTDMACTSHCAPHQHANSIVCDTHPLTHDFGAFHHSESHAHDMTQQQVAAGLVQQFRSRTEASGGLCRVGPSHPHLNARLTQCPALLAKHGQRRLLGHATILEQACDSRGWVTSGHKYSRKFHWGLSCLWPSALRV